MTLKEVVQHLSELEIPFVYGMYLENEAPELPYIVYSKGSSNDFIADNINYLSVYSIHIDLYQDYKNGYDFKIEKKIRDLFVSNNKAFYMSSPFYIESENMYQTTFTIDVIEKDDEDGFK